MAQYDGSIRINTEIDTNGIRRGESVVRGSLNRISEAARSTATLLASVFAVKKLIQFGKEAIELGSDLEEVQNVVDVTFTTMSEKVNEFAKNAAVSAGLSETMAKRYVGTFGAMSKSFGFAEDEAYKMSTALTQLSGDVASFYNISQDEAYVKLKSVFTGETETLKDLGVVMTQAALDQYALANGFGKTTSKMTEQEKVALRYRFVMEQLAGASGDFIRTSDSWANQTRILKLQVESLMATIGQGLINIFTPVIKVINILLGKLATVANAFKSFTELITGKKSSAGSGGAAGAGIVSGGLGDSIDGYNDAADAADNLAISTEKVADATEDAEKAAEGYLSPLDEINKFRKNEELADLKEPEAGINIGDISGIENIDYGKVAEGENVLDKVSESANGLIGKLKELAGIFKQGFFDGLGDWEYRWDSIKDSIQSIKDSLKDIFTDPAVISAADSFVKSVAYMLGSLVGATASIGLTIATNIVGGIAKYLEENKDRIKEHLVSMFNIWEEVNYLLSDLFQSFAYVFEAFASEDGQRLTANLIGIFTDAFMGVAELASKLIRDVLNIFIQPFVDNKEGFRTALEGFLSVLADVAGTIKDAIDATFDKLNEVYDKHFKPFFDSVAQGLSDLVGEFLEFWNGDVQPLLKYIASGFDELWKSHIQPLINHAIELLGKFADFLKMIWEEIVKPFISWIIQNVLPKILPIIQGIWDALKEACAWVIDIFDAIINKLGEFIDWLTEHKGVVEDFIIIIGSFIAAFEVAKIATSIAGIVSALSTFVTSGGLATAAATALSGALTALGSVIAFLTSPIGLITVAVGTLIAGFVLLYKHSEGFRNFINGIVEGAKQLIPGIIEGIKSGWTAFTDWLGSLWQGIVDGFKNFFGIHSPSTVMAELGKYIIEGLLNGIKSLVPNVQEIWEGMKEAAVNIWNSMKDSLADTWESIKQTASQVWDGIKQNLSEKWNNIKSGAKTTFDNVKNGIKESWTNIKSNVKESAENVKTNITNAWAKAKETTASAWNNIKEKAVSSAQSMAGGVRDKFSGMQSAVSNFSSSAQSIWSRAWEGMQGKVGSVLDSVKNTVSSVFGWISSTIGSLGNSLRNLTSRVISSRSTSSYSYGRNYSFAPASALVYQSFAFDPLKNAPIPKLATGAVIPANKEFLAVLGDQKHGTNVEAPLDTIKQAQRESILEVLSELGVTGNRGSSNQQTIIIKQYLDGKQVAESVVKEGKIQQMATGNNMFALGTT